MGDTRNHVVKSQDGVCAVVVARAVGAEDCAKDSEDEHKIQSGLLETAFGECCDGDCDQLDAAQEQGQIVEPCHGIMASQTGDENFEQLKSVDQKRRDDKNFVFLRIVLGLIFSPKEDCRRDHNRHQAGYKQKMLPGQKALGSTGVSTPTKKFFHTVSSTLQSNNRKR